MSTLNLAPSGARVLVAEADALGALGVIRSLGRAGHVVHACARMRDALGLHSRFAARSAVHPPYDSEDFLPWLQSYVALNGIEVLIPSEGFLLALRGRFDAFAHLLPLAPREEVVLAALSKFDLFQRLQQDGQGAHLPPSLLIDDLAHLPSREELEALGRPLYVKVDGRHAKLPGLKGSVTRASSAEEARAVLASSAAQFHKALVQGHVDGEGVGAFFLLRDGEVLAEFMHRRLHEVPHTGGISSLRESWFDRVIRDDALAKLRSMRWQGVAMMEYRRDPRTGRFHLLEMNARFWGSLHLALHAGVDFPRLLLDAHLGRPVQVPAYRTHVRCRYTFPGEVQHVWSCLKDRALDRRMRAGKLLEFAALSLDPRVKTDLWFPGDAGLYFRELERWAGDWARGVLGRARRSLRRTEAPERATAPSDARAA